MSGRLYELKTLWNGGEADRELRYKVWLDPEFLNFRAVFPEVVKGHPEAERGVFTPELWKWDVAELFILGVGGRYVEINLAPSGAWWAEGFSSARVREASFNYERYGFSVDESGEVLSVSIDALEEFLGPLPEWKGNVTGILGTPDYVFLSKALLPGEEADFHQPKAFPPLGVMII